MINHITITYTKLKWCSTPDSVFERDSFITLLSIEVSLKCNHGQNMVGMQRLSSRLNFTYLCVFVCVYTYILPIDMDFVDFRDYIW